jgi:hypothetical protein
MKYQFAFSWRLAAIAALVSVLAVATSLSIWQRLSTVPPGSRDGSTFELIEGVGLATPAGFEITEVGKEGRAIVATELPNVRANHFERVGFDIEGLDSAGGAGIYFTVSSQPTVGHPRALTLRMAREGSVSIAEDPRWTGEVQTLGFIIQGPLKRPVLIKNVTLFPVSAPEKHPAFWGALGLLYFAITYAGLALLLAPMFRPAEADPAQRTSDED